MEEGGTRYFISYFCKLNLNKAALNFNKVIKSPEWDGKKYKYKNFSNFVCWKRNRFQFAMNTWGVYGNMRENFQGYVLSFFFLLI